MTLTLRTVCVLMLVCLGAGCKSNGGNGPTPAPTSPTPPPPATPPRAAVALNNAQGSVVKQSSGSGYDYTLQVTATESGGAAATFSAWDVTFRAGSSGCGATHFSAADLTAFGASISARSTKILEFAIHDTPSVSWPQCTSFSITVTYSDAQGALGTTSSSGDITLKPSPPSPPASGRYKCSGSSCVFDPNDSGANQCTPGGNSCVAPTPPSPPTPQPQPPPSPSEVTMVWAMTNNCSISQYYKLFDQTNRLVWPGSSSHYSLNPGASQNHRLSCRTGANICAGGSTNPDGSGTQFGVGFKNNQGCTDCCFTCRESTVRGQITCRTTIADSTPTMSGGRPMSAGARPSRRDR